MRTWIPGARTQATVAATLLAAQAHAAAAPGDKLLVSFGAIAAFVSGIVGGAFALWKWVYEARVDAERTRATAVVESANNEKQFYKDQVSRADHSIEQLKSELESARRAEKEALRFAHEAAHASPAVVEEAMKIACATLRAENDRLRESLNQTRATLHERESQLEKLRKDYGADQEALDAANASVKELQAQFAVLEQEVRAAASKQAEVEHVVLLVEQGYFDPEIVRGQTANVYARVDAAARKVRAAAAIERMTTQSLRRTRATNEHFRARIEVLEREEKEEETRHHLRQSLPPPDPPTGIGPPRDGGNKN